MNEWTRLSVEIAKNGNYLDRLYEVYPIKSNVRRGISREARLAITESYNNHDGERLLKELLKLELFPIKDCYVPYLRKDSTAIERNQATVNRIIKNLFSMELSDIIYKCTEPKESNRQMGPMFKNWIKSGVLECNIYEDEMEFLHSDGNAVFISSDGRMKKFAAEFLGYTRIDKGLDFIARFNDIYVIAEAKYITDFGGHQNDQFDDAISTLTSKIDTSCGRDVKVIAILDGVIYIEGNNKLFKYLKNNNDYVILSALVLKKYLNSLGK